MANKLADGDRSGDGKRETGSYGYAWRDGRGMSKERTSRIWFGVRVGGGRGRKGQL